MSANTVSFVIPVYNASNFLVRCVESIRRQTYTDIQIILINDGSSDVSVPLCEMFKKLDERVVIIDRPHSGISETRNAGLKAARGKYIQFADSDDYLPPDATERMVNAMKSCDMAIAPYILVINDVSRKYTCIEREGILTRDEFMEDLLRRPGRFYYGVLWNKLYRTDIIKNNRIQFDSELNWCEDFMFNIAYLRHARRIHALSRPVYFYVKNPESVTMKQLNMKKMSEMTFTKRYIFRDYKGLVKSLGLYEGNRARVYKYFISTGGHI